ncbi:unnamed protein product [Urochloa decumbens]|uniref:Uncharacterized protein n=1 Tax=Urochloa decumbens TaxID=240449 RepID=A0ABC9F6Y0_9POAL
MSRAEAAIRQAGALVALAAASALMLRFPATGHAVLLALHALFLLGCAAVQLAPAHRAVAGLARRAAEAARGKVLRASAAGLWRWVGFAGILLYAFYDYEAAEVRAEASSPVKVKAFLLFLVFLGAVWAVYLSMVTGSGAPAPRPSAAAAEDDGGELNDPVLHVSLLIQSSD